MENSIKHSFGVDLKSWKQNPVNVPTYVSGMRRFYEGGRLKVSLPGGGFVDEIDPKFALFRTINFVSDMAPVNVAAASWMNHIGMYKNFEWGVLHRYGYLCVKSAYCVLSYAG